MVRADGGYGNGKRYFYVPGSGFGGLDNTNYTMRRARSPPPRENDLHPHWQGDTALHPLERIQCVWHGSVL
jgi:hypothetical protein